jgi:GT2 family glycosyltransferase
MNAVTTHENHWRPSVAVIVLNWNRSQETVQCLKSLACISYLAHEVILVDNGSTDGSVETISTKFPHVTILASHENLGYPAGNNLGIRYAMKRAFDYVLLLNNDTVVDSAFLDELVKAAENDPLAGFLGPKVYYYDFSGRKDVISFAGGRLSLWRATSVHLRANQIDRGKPENILEVDFVEGSCVLVKCAMLDHVGLLTTDFFAYWEDVDWCVRGRRAGYKSLYVPAAKIWHKVSASGIGPRRMYFMTRNRVWFMKRHASPVQNATFIIFFAVWDFWFTCVSLLLGFRGIAGLREFLRGLRDAADATPAGGSNLDSNRASSLPPKRESLP